MTASAATAAAGALSGFAVLFASCAANTVHLHLSVFHAGGVALAALLGGLAAAMAKAKDSPGPGQRLGRGGHRL